MRCVVVILFCWVALQSTFSADESLRISEFAAGGRQGLLDEDGDSPDWIEIQNVSAGAIDLSGWSLKARRDKAWEFPATNLADGNFLVVFASGKDRRVPGQRPHTDFKLSAEGGTLVLSGPKGEVSSITNYPPQVAGVSFGFAGATADSSNPNYRYLRSPTPGRTNAPPVWSGPEIMALAHRPELPATNDEIVVTAKVSGTLATVAKVTLRYRVMFEAEAELPMQDDGEHKDGAARDGTYGATITKGRAKAGQMLRYYVVAQDDQGRSSRWPLFANRPGYSAYQGTVVADPSIQSRLPVLHLLTARNNQRSIGNAAVAATLFYGGELYDNVIMSDHGQISRGFPKPSYNLRFPRDHRFKYRTKEDRVSEVKILGNFADKSKIRNTLAYEMIAAAGSIGHFAFPVRIQQDGRFLCIAEMVEDGDDRWLERLERDPHGALYKMYNNLVPGAQAEKKTRKTENQRDLSRFAEFIGEHRPLAQRVAYAYDHVDIPQCVSYFVAMALISSGDHGHKNYYLYRDTRGSGEWALLPWDVDLSWGRNWMKTYFDDRLYADNPLSLYRAGRNDRARNPLYDLFFVHPEFREMYLRRLRTVMDELLQAPGTPTERLIIEKCIADLIDSIDPPEFRESDADLDSARWPAWPPKRSAREEADRIMKEYLPGRRKFLFESGRATLHGDPIPPSQPENVALGIARIDGEARPEEQFICITNRNEFAVDVTGWKIKGAGIEHECRPGTVIPAGKPLYVVADVGAFRRRKEEPRGSQSLFVQGNWKGTLRRDGNVEILDRKGRVVGREARD